MVEGRWVACAERILHRDEHTGDWGAGQEARRRKMFVAVVEGGLEGARQGTGQR